MIPSLGWLDPHRRGPLSRAGAKAKPLGALALLAALALGSSHRSAATDASASPQRIVAIAPNVVELLFALGLEERIAGVGDHAHWPPAVGRKRRLGGLFDPRLEEIVALRPDLAVLLPSEEELGRRLRALGVEVLQVEHETLADVEQAIATIAQRCGASAAGERLVQRWRRELAPRPVPGNPRVMLSLSRAPGRFSQILVAGPGTFLDELLRRLEARNAFDDSPLRYPQVGPEEILARDPEVIVELVGETLPQATAEALLADWQRLPQLQAVRCGRVHVVDGSHTLVPGPRLPALYRRLRQVLTP